jgi:hypothetical protein
MLLKPGLQIPLNAKQQILKTKWDIGSLPDDGFCIQKEDNIVKTCW